MIEELLQGRDIEAREFKHVVDIDVTAEGQNKQGRLEIGASDFLVTNIEVIGYANNGDLYDELGRTKDKFTIQIKNAASGVLYSDAGVNVSLYEPSQDNVVPHIIKNGSRIDVEIKHERSVSTTVFLKEPVSYVDGDGNPINDQNAGLPPSGYGANQTAFPVKFHVVFSGIKLIPKTR